MDTVDKRKVLANEVFTYQISKEKKVFIAWNGRQVKVLKGKEAQKFISMIVGLNDEEGQLVMAKATGNFKHGNER